MNASDRPQITPANTTPTPKESREMPYVDPCATCRIRDHWCCDPWENHFDHEGDDQ